MTSMFDQFFFFVVEKHPWTLKQFNESRISSINSPPRDGIKIESQIIKQSNTPLNAFNNTFEPMDLETDTMDTFEPLQSNVYCGSPSGDNNNPVFPPSDIRNQLSGSVSSVQKIQNNDTSETRRSDSGIDGVNEQQARHQPREEHFLTAHCTESTSHDTERENRLETRNEEQKCQEQPNHIRDLVAFKPLDNYENKRKLIKRRQNRAYRRNRSRKLARYNEFEYFINFVNDQIIPYMPQYYYNTSYYYPRPRYIDFTK